MGFTGCGPEDGDPGDPGKIYFAFANTGQVTEVDISQFEMRSQSQYNFDTRYEVKSNTGFLRWNSNDKLYELPVTILANPGEEGGKTKVILQGLFYQKGEKGKNGGDKTFWIYISGEDIRVYDGNLSKEEIVVQSSYIGKGNVLNKSESQHITQNLKPVKNID